MDRRIKPTPGPRNDKCRVEPLEERWLLSGLQAPVSTETEPESPVADIAPTTQEFDGAVEVVELTVATEDDDGKVEVAPSKLPREIVAALDARLPGAKLINAERGTDEGFLVYDVSAEWSGRLVGVTLMPDGSIIEMEQAVAAGELPQPVLDWVRQNFPGAAIDEAIVVTSAGTESYDVRIATGDQQQFEATLRLPGAAATGVSIAVNNASSQPIADDVTTANATIGIPYVSAATATVALE